MEPIETELPIIPIQTLIGLGTELRSSSLVNEVSSMGRIGKRVNELIRDLNFYMERFCNK